MLAKIFKYIAVMSLLAIVTLRPSPGYALIAQFIVCAAATMAAVESFESRKLFVAIVFTLVALAFNPVFPLSVSQPVLLSAEIVAVGIFTVSIVTFRARPRLSVASITDRTPGSESL